MEEAARPPFPAFPPSTIPHPRRGVPAPPFPARIGSGSLLAHAPCGSGEMRHRGLAILVAVIGLAASVGLFVVLRAQDDADTRAVIATEAVGVHYEVTARLDEAVHG